MVEGLIAGHRRVDDLDLAGPDPEPAELLAHRLLEEGVDRLLLVRGAGEKGRVPKPSVPRPYSVDPPMAMIRKTPSGFFLATLLFSRKPSGQCSRSPRRAHVASKPRVELVRAEPRVVVGPPVRAAALRA